MELITNLTLLETQRRAKMEINHTIRIINQINDEWKYKRKRRRNAVDLITASVNKLSNIDPSLIDQIHDNAKTKLTIILMRCMDNPLWKPLSVKEKIYRKLEPLISKLQTAQLDTGTDGNLCEIILTRLSACVAYQNNEEGNDFVFVGYEPKMATKYIKYLFGDSVPLKTYRMQPLGLPATFEELASILQINQDKANQRYLDSKD